ncbi:hypothetical protein GO495_28265 [Chitinophaga oryziterrae]|uniref:Uncharacterized protein n=1 Tax=Chitinophaga oryziterrae TaxID=1031224 RepID=A0A6N8JK14_9BACT|nr:DUF5908 family protein [Chitinophaga oryziterrae]MVT44522.1 hypothetical protein [Chitinophaga oryziterrae]
MPLEIRELVIKVTIESNTTQRTQMPDENYLQALKASIVKECMENILQRIDNTDER